MPHGDQNSWCTGGGNQSPKAVPRKWEQPRNFLQDCVTASNQSGKVDRGQCNSYHCKLFCDIQLNHNSAHSNIHSNPAVLCLHGKVLEVRGYRGGEDVRRWQKFPPCPIDPVPRQIH